MGSQSLKILWKTSRGLDMGVGVLVTGFGAFIYINFIKMKVKMI
jgi:hypothetical protein